MAVSHRLQRLLQGDAGGCDARALPVQSGPTPSRCVPAGVALLRKQAASENIFRLLPLHPHFLIHSAAAEAPALTQRVKAMLTELTAAQLSKLVCLLTLLGAKCFFLCSAEAMPLHTRGLVLSCGFLVEVCSRWDPEPKQELQARVLWQDWG